MKSEDIHITDWQRIFIGDVPGGFYLEVICRTIIVYLVLMVSMRLMGKRMASQLSRTEMVAMVSLAAAIGVPIQSPDRGILASVVIAFVVVIFQQVLAGKASKNQKVETLSQGDLTILIEDGHMNLEKMKSNGITRERAFAQLRSESIKQLGEVKRLYFEAGGSFTLIENTEVGPGLGILPEYDKNFRQQRYKFSGSLVCHNCGQLAPDNKSSEKKCANCGSNEWDKAVE